ncbi:MAG: zinc-ribbon domain-containing protein [Acholeplasmatales bacterium]|jgi:hypothetical protein|nr:zinc-ribbon domain-containing protein [Acholeplasmatales bacterium]
MKKCNVCGYEADNDDNSFCAKCGNRLEELKCVSCGAKLREDDVFCPKCGNKTNNGGVYNGVVQKEQLLRNDNISKSANLKKQVLWIVAVSISFLSIIFIFLAFSTGWILDSGHSFLNRNTNVYYIFLNIIRNVSGDRGGNFSSIKTIIEVLGNFRKINDYDKVVWTLLIPNFIILLIKTAVLPLLIVLLVNMIIVVVKRKEVPKIISKINAILVALFVAGIISVGNVNITVYLASIFCIINIIVLKLCAYLEPQKRANIIPYIPNFVGTALIIICIMLLGGLSSFLISRYGFTSLKSYIKYPYLIARVFGSHSAVVYVNLAFFVITSVILAIYIKARISSFFEKVKNSTRVLGIILVCFMFILCISNLTLGISIKKSNYEVHYGTTAAILVFLILSIIADFINIKPTKYNFLISGKE